MDERYEKRGYLLEDFRLFHLQDSKGVKTDYHYHEFCKLLLLVSGSGSYTVEGLRYALAPGDAVLLGHHCVHRSDFEPGRPYERIILYISPAFLQRESTGSCCLEDCFSGAGGHVLRLPEKHFQRLHSLASALEQELSMNHYGCAVASNGLLLQLLAQIGRYQHDGSVQWPQPLCPESNLIQKLLGYLERNLDQDLSIDTLAQQFYTSRYHLMRQFRRETGVTIHSYICERRLFLARSLMRQGMSSTDACFHAGFGSYSAFSRAYTRLFGTTPTGRPERARDDSLE